MLRKRAVALAISLMFPAVAPALGLGTLKATSALNQPFEGKIEIIGATAGDFDSLVIKLADSAQFDRAGLIRSAPLMGLKFEVVTNPNGNDYVRVYTREAVREPYLDFLIEMNWLQGKMIREYTVLLDPPLYDPNRRQPKPAATAPATMAPPTPAAQSRPTAPRAAPAVAAGGELGPAQSGDTLWSLARRNLPGNGVSVNQMMVALLRANPQSFPTGNMNLLTVGTILKLPSAGELAAITRQDASAEIGRQTQSWQEYRQGASRTTTPQLARGNDLTAPAAKAPPAKPPADAHLEIVAASDQAGATAGAPGADESKVAAQADTTKELKARLDEAEEIIDLLKRQVEVKNDELARMQGQQVGKGVEVPAAARIPAAAKAPDAPAPEGPLAATPAAAAPAVESPPVAAEPNAPAAAPVEVPAPTPAPAKPAADPRPAPKIVASPPPASSGGLDDLVPGGLMTLLGAAVSLLALGALALRKRFGKPASTPASAAPIARAGLAPAVDALDQNASAATADSEVAQAQVAPPSDDAAFDRHSRTIEATADSLQVDPLEEVNVYLAYERFDQAEELVRKAIADHPEEARYQHRLLEIFYFSNNLTAYEHAAREFHDKVGEDDPMWQSVVAMWEAMSPQRALFTAGAGAVATASAPTEFVDLTATADASAEASMESTHVGFFGATTDNQAPPLAEAGDPLLDGILDITAGETEESEMLDLTATVEKLEQAGYLEHEDPAHDTTNETDMFDISGSSAEIAGALDALEPEDADTQDPSDTVQLLDLSATGDLFKVGDAAQSDARVLGLSNTASGGGLATADAELTSEVDFDIGELSDLNLDATSNPLDLGLDEADNADELDFDIGALGAEPVVDVFDQSVVLGAPIAAQPSAPAAQAALDGPTDFSLDLDLPEVDAPAGADHGFATEAPDMLDLTTELPEMLDLTTDISTDLNLGYEASAAGATAGAELDLDTLNFSAADEGIDLDLSLDETRELNDIFVDDAVSPRLLTDETLDPSMRDLTAELEASMAAFDTPDTVVGEDDFILDLTAADQDASIGDALDVDFTLDGSLTQDMSLAETVIRDDFDPADGMPTNPNGGDEVDTKLNLAKAYIELGEKDAARSILLEAAREGTGQQQEEAGRLLAQVT